MDFSITDEQRALAELAGRIFADRSKPERLKAIERSDERFDRELWTDLAKAGLLGAALPAEVGGSGGGFVDLCLLLVEQGRRVPLVPLVPCLVSAAMPIAKFGSAEQKKRWLPETVGGSTILTAALTEAGEDPRSPATRATRDGRGWRLDGVKIGVPLAAAAAVVVVPARADSGETLVLLVDPKGPGVLLERQVAANFEAQYRMELSGAAVAESSVLRAEDGRSVLQWIVDRTTVALSALASGACQETVRLTAEYATNRKQFGKPIATFQAVGQRMADGYIDNEAVSLTMWAAATLLESDEHADLEVATAKYWAAEAGSRIAHTGLHVHGGISIDVDYPVHRYFNWLKQIEVTLGGASAELERLGALIAAS